MANFMWLGFLQFLLAFLAVALYPICYSVCLCVQKVYCGKAADWIRMPFGMVTVVGRRMGVLDGVVIIKGEGTVLGVNVGHPVVTTGDFIASLCESA